MSALQGKVGSIELSWVSAPLGASGTAYLELKKGEKTEIRWRRDANGVWIETPNGVSGFDIVAEVADDGRMVYNLVRRGGGGEWKGLSFMRAGEDSLQAAAGTKKKSLRIRAQMPGKIVRILVKPGQAVEKEQPLLVMEAMKMENEIRAPHAGKITEVKVSESQAVDSGADLMLMGD